jgi:hypothetical protein
VTHRRLNAVPFHIQILRALAAATASGCPESFKGRAAALVLEGLLAGNDSQLELLDEKVSAAALLSAKSLDHPLLNGVFLPVIWPSVCIDACNLLMYVCTAGAVTHPTDVVEGSQANDVQMINNC